MISAWKREGERAQQSFGAVAMTVGGWLVWHCPKTKLSPRLQRIARAKHAAPLPLPLATRHQNHRKSPLPTVLVLVSASFSWRCSPVLSESAPAVVGGTELLTTSLPGPSFVAQV
jgi:hypothetical protein